MRTWIGRHTPITIGPIAKPLTRLILPQCDVTRRQTNDVSHVCFHNIEEVAHAHVQNAPLEWFSSTPGLGVVLRLQSEICWLRIQ